MPLDHRRLTVYRVTLQLLAMIDEIVEQLPPGRAHLKDQLDRAATSIVLNVAEGPASSTLATRRASIAWHDGPPWSPRLF
ncbi:MAG TPA: four helix bundle protein [Vicinamibacteria bacterium]|nr:four helix bundle protein [Vicinamibacteria bacterium]